jgi:nicotine blue oxidoreductase
MSGRRWRALAAGRHAARRRITRAVASAGPGGATAAVATYEGDARTPVGLTREVWADVARTAIGDVGARGWLRAHPHLVIEVECADLGRWSDINTPTDLPH